MKLGSNLGMMLLGVWLILTGLIPLVLNRGGGTGLGLLMDILAIGAGALILMNR